MSKHLPFHRKCVPILFCKAEVGKVGEISRLRPNGNVMTISVKFSVKQSSKTFSADEMGPIEGVPLGRKRFVATDVSGMVDDDSSLVDDDAKNLPNLVFYSSLTSLSAGAIQI